jgi:hypothetical protein
MDNEPTTEPRSDFEMKNLFRRMYESLLKWGKYKNRNNPYAPVFRERQAQLEKELDEEAKSPTQ